MKLHILVRDDLAPPWLEKPTDVQRAVYKGVQSGHAVAEFLLRGPLTRWTNGTLIYLKVKDERELKKWYHKLIDAGLPCVPFHEPDIGDEMTAFATFGADQLVGKLSLL